MKVETYLRMAKIQYQVRVAWPQDAPKGHLPYILDDESKGTIADSTLILEHLKKRFGDPLDSKHSPRDLAVGFAFQKLLEDHLYFIGVYLRWIYPPGWKAAEPGYFGKLKGLRRYVIPLIARRMTKRRLMEQGMGMNSEAEVFHLGRQSLGAVSQFLGEKRYFLGEAPSSVDATVFAFLAGLFSGPFESPLKTFALEQGNLKPYCDRMLAAYFPEYHAIK